MRKKWTNEEVAVLREQKDLSAQDLKKSFFPYRSVKSIQRRKDLLRGEELLRYHEPLGDYDYLTVEKHIDKDNNYLSELLQRGPDQIDKIRHSIKKGKKTRNNIATVVIKEENHKSKDMTDRINFKNTHHKQALLKIKTWLTESGNGDADAGLFEADLLRNHYLDLNYSETTAHNYAGRIAKKILGMRYWQNPLVYYVWEPNIIAKIDALMGVHPNPKQITNTPPDFIEIYNSRINRLAEIDNIIANNESKLSDIYVENSNLKKEKEEIQSKINEVKNILS